MRGAEDLTEHVRGVSLSTVLRHAGKIFEHSDGSAEMCAVSRRVTHIGLVSPPSRGAHSDGKSSWP